MVLASPRCADDDGGAQATRVVMSKRTKRQNRQRMIARRLRKEKARERHAVVRMICLLEYGRHCFIPETFFPAGASVDTPIPARCTRCYTRSQVSPRDMGFIRRHTGPLGEFTEWRNQWRYVDGVTE